MDERLFTRFRSGDPEARAQLQEQLARLAERVLAYPDWRVEPPQVRRLVALDAAREALERGARDLDGLFAGAILVANRKAVEHLRQRDPPGEPPEGAGAHVAPGLLVSAALVPNAMAGPSLAAVERHLQACERCRADAERVREATAAAAGPGRREAEASPPASPEDVPEPAALGEASDVLRQAGEAARAALAPTREAAEKKGELPQFRPVRARPAEAPRRRSPPSPLVLVLAVALLAGLAWWHHGSSSSSRSPVAPSLAALAETDPPPLPPPSRWPEDARAALQDLSAGQCSTAAARFRHLRLRGGSSLPRWKLLYYEGVSLNCARDPSGLELLREALHEAPEEQADDLRWALVQAELLAGDAEAARIQLFDMGLSASPYAARARALEQRLDELQEGR